jgi:hypothetical protein
MIFCKRKGGQQYEFKLYGSNIEIVELYSYIRLTFTYNGKLTLAKKTLFKTGLLQIDQIPFNLF